MILHLGLDRFVRLNDVILILDYEQAIQNQDTKAALSLGKDEKENKAKSIVLISGPKGVEWVFSPIAAATLLTRAKGSRIGETNERGNEKKQYV